MTGKIAAIKKKSNNMTIRISGKDARKRKDQGEEEEEEDWEIMHGKEKKRKEKEELKKDEGCEGSR